MRVLIIAHGHPAFSIGGAEVASHNLMRGLDGTGEVEAHFLAAAHRGMRRHADTPLMSLRQGEREVFMHTEGWDPFWLSNARGLTELQDAFDRYLRQVQPDVVHFHHVIGFGVEAIVQARRSCPDAAIVITFHEYLPICFNHGQMVKTSRNALCRSASPADCATCFPEHSAAEFFRRESFLKDHFALADAFVSPSQFLIERYVAWGLQRERFALIENGLAAQAPAAPRPLAAGARRGRFGYFGQLSEFKGLLVLLEAVASVEDELWGNDAVLCIFGGGVEHQPAPFQAKFAELLERAGRRARLYGRYRSEELPRLMEQVDWVVMPSIWWENSPVVIQEAFLHGRPPIVGDIGGMAEKVTHGTNGLTFRAGSPEDLGDRLREALSDPTLWPRLRENAPAPLNLADFAQRHLELYGKAIEARRSAPQPARRQKRQAA